MSVKTATTVFLGIALLTLVTLLIYTKMTPNHHKYSNAYGPMQEGSFLDDMNEYLTSKVRSILLNNGFNLTESELSKCPKKPLHPVGQIHVNLSPIPSMEEVEKALNHTNITIGGHWTPSDCTARHKVAIVVPFQEREEHLKIFLKHMHPFLQKQNLDYGIYIVEQAQGLEFNRGALLNIGFKTAIKEYNYQCFFFHDVDNLPADDRIYYRCTNFPYHLATAVAKFGYGLPYEGYVGGVFSIRTHQFRKINGFSNVYFGWGAEDDDLWQRITHAKLPIKRYTGGIFRFQAIPHKQHPAANDRMVYLSKAATRFGRDGLSSLKFDLITNEKKRLYTHVKVQLDKNQLRNVD